MTWDSSIFIFGKLPSQLDFVRYNASGPDIIVLDQWIQEGMYIAARRFDKDWDRIYKGARGCYFLFQSGQSLYGFLNPSFDRSERKYPFIISLRMNHNSLGQGDIFLMPLVLKDTLEKFRSLTLDGISGLPIQELISRTENSGKLHHMDLEYYRKDLNVFLESTPVDSLWERLFGTSFHLKSKIFVNKLSEALYPFKSKENVRMSFGLRFPLTERSSEQEHEICFWLSVCRLLIHRTSFFPFIFWKDPAVGEKNWVYVFFSRPPGRFFLHLIDSGTDDDSVYSLDPEGNGEDKDSNLDRLIDPRKEDKTESGTLMDFLKRIQYE